MLKNCTYPNPHTHKHTHTHTHTHTGSPSRLATTTLNITLLDENDHQPIFIGAPYIETVQEGTTGPLVIITVLAIDQDVSSNGEIVYSGGNDIFSINPITVSDNFYGLFAWYNVYTCTFHDCVYGIPELVNENLNGLWCHTF